MAFLFKSKKNQDKASAVPKDSLALNGQPQPSFLSNGQRVVKESPVEVKNQGTPTSSVNNSVASLSEKQQALSGAPITSPEQTNLRKMTENGVSDLPLRNASNNPSPALSSPVNPNASLYPWSQRRITYTTAHPSPFPRYGAAVNSVSSKEGDIYMMGGSGNMACYPLRTTAEGPGPRVGHASLLVGNAFIVYGGDTKMDDADILDETLYLLNTSTKQWSRAVPAGPRPTGRYGHSLNILGSKIYVFGGQVEGYFMNDLVAFDLNQLQVPTNRWEFLIQNSDQGGPPAGQIPPARTNHTVVTYNEKLYLFGGTNGYQWFSDVWSYDPTTNTWSSLDCIGYIPASREGHAAALVDDVMYIFGGRTEDGNDLGDLAAFRISSRRWYTFQNMGPSPSPRSGHSMTAYNKQIVVLAGEPSSATGVPQDLASVYVLDTSKIRYPNDQGTIPAGTTRARGPSIGEKSVMQPVRTVVSPPKEGLVTNGAAPKRLNGILEQQVSDANNMARQVGETMNTDNSPNGFVSQVMLPQKGSSSASSQARSMQVSSPTNDISSLTISTPQSASTRQTVNTIVPEQMRPAPSKANMPVLSTNLRTSSREREPLSDARNRSLSPIKDSPIMKEGTNITGRKSSTPAVTKIVPQQEDQPPVIEISQSRSSSNSRQARGQPPVDSAIETTVKPRPSSPPPPTRNGSTRKLVSRDSSNRNSQSIVILKEMETMRNKNAWLTSELELARKAGYVSNSAINSSIDSTSAESFGEADRPLIEALIAMRTELSNVQSSIDQQAVLAARKIAEIEKQRDTAVTEAVYAKAKLAAHGGSSTSSTPQLDNASRDPNSVDTSRSNEMGRKLAQALTSQRNLQHQVDMLTAELMAEKRARDLADDAATSAQLKMADLESYRQTNSAEVERLKAELHNVSKEFREQALTCTAAVTSAKLLQSDKESLESRHRDLESTAKEHSETFESLREAIIASGNMRDFLQRKLDEERLEREKSEEKLSILKLEHETITTNMDLLARKLKDAEDLMQQHKFEAETHRKAVLSGLSNVTTRDVRSDSAASDGGKIAILLAQIETLNDLSRQHQASADTASEKLRSAEERIAGLEAYQEQVSREGLSIRKQLQAAMRETQSLQAANSSMKHQLANQQLETNAVSVQHNTLKDILGERGVSPINNIRTRGVTSPQTREDTPEMGRVRELEQQLASVNASYEETKIKEAARAEEAEANYREKLSQLENDYQSAVHYVKGTEKMLKRMKDELSRYKTENTRLTSELNEAQTQARQSDTRDIPNWDSERATLHSQIDALQANLTTSHTAMEKQMASIKEELAKSNADRDLHITRHTAIQQELTQSMTQSRQDLSQLQHENAMLESRAIDAEQKVSMLLNQVESSVDNYRRQSKQESGGSSQDKGFGHNRHVSDVGSIGGDSTYSSPTKDRNSMALDSLATELETLRSHWETTNKNYRLSSQSHRTSQVFDLDRQINHERPATSTGVGGSYGSVGLGVNTSLAATGIDEEHESSFFPSTSSRSPVGVSGGELSSSLADWRRRLEMEEQEAMVRKSSV